MKSALVIEEKQITVMGRFFKTIRLQAEGYEFVDFPGRALEQLITQKVNADIFTFTQRLSKRIPEFQFHAEADSLAVLRIESYDIWWKRRINDKTRNMVRKAAKKGVTVRVVKFDDELVSGIESIHNEAPIRQGKPFKHFGKTFETVKNEHSTFLDRSDFIGAYYEGELIGIVKLVHQGAWSSLMQIISKISHRDKAPTNALIAKAVEICAERGVPHLQYGIWSTRGIGDFKLHHGFERIEVPRYYVPLTLTGRLMLRFGLHRGVAEFMPKRVLDFLIDVRSRWYNFKFRKYRTNGAVAQMAEPHANAWG
jgi:hypothetical protein